MQKLNIKEPACFNTGRKENPVLSCWLFLLLNILLLCTSRDLSVSLLDNSCRAFFSTFSAVRALLVINVCDVILYGDRTGFALLLTELAGQTSGLADLLDSGAAVVAGTAYGISGGFRDKLDEVTRAGGNTFSTRLAFAAVYMGDTLIDGNCAKRTGGGAGTKTNASIVTGPRGEPAACGGSTIVNPDVTASGCRIFTVAGAFDISGDFFCLFHLKAEQVADFFCDRIASDRTGVDRRLLIGNSRGESVAAGIATATAVIAGQAFADGDLLFIYLYFKFFIDCDEQNADQQSEDGHCKCGDNDR